LDVNVNCRLNYIFGQYFTQILFEAGMVWNNQREKVEDFCFGRRIDIAFLGFHRKSASGRRIHYLISVLNKNLTSGMPKLMVFGIICLLNIQLRYFLNLVWFGIAKGRGVRICGLAIGSTW
jgi:hypothetical protein